MPRCSTPELQVIVDQLLLVVDPQVSTALANLRYVLVERCMALSHGNPAIYLNSEKAQARVVGWVNSAKIGNVEAVQGDSVAVNKSQMGNVPLLYGILLHESAHAWAEKCGIVNSERTAYLFEIQWVCALAAAPQHPLGPAMRTGLQAYFARRSAQFQKADGVLEALDWSLKRYDLA